MQPLSASSSSTSAAASGRASSPGAELPLALRARGALPGRRRVHARATRTRSCRRSASSTCTSSARAGTRRCTSSSARTCASSTASPASSFAVWAPTARAVSVVGDFNGWDGRAAPDARARRLRRSGSSSSPTCRTGRTLQVRDPHADGELREKADPFAFHTETPPANASMVFRSRHEWHDAEWLERRRAAEPLARRCRSTRCTSARGGTNPLEGNRSLELPRARRRARRLRERPRLHARRAAARDGAPVQRLVGLPGDGLLRADLALRLARRLPLLRRPAAPATASA